MNISITQKPILQSKTLINPAPRQFLNKKYINSSSLKFMPGHISFKGLFKSGHNNSDKLIDQAIKHKIDHHLEIINDTSSQSSYIINATNSENDLLRIAEQNSEARLYILQKLTEIPNEGINNPNQKAKALSETILKFMSNSNYKHEFVIKM